MFNQSIGFIGAGNMAQAMIKGLLNAGVPVAQIIASSHSEQTAKKINSQYGISTTTNNQQLAEQADIIVLAAKPFQLKAICQSIQQPVKTSMPLIISVAAGIHCEHLITWLDCEVSCIRTMPNTPVLVTEGMTGAFGNHLVTAQQKSMANKLLVTLGKVLWVDKEALLDAVTAISGSGPAYFFLFVEALEAAAEKLGLDQAAAKMLARQTALGSAKMLCTQENSAGNLRASVTSKGGTTAKAIEVFENLALRDIVTQATSAAYQKSQSLAQEIG